jgi:hypothetical protein
MKRPSWFNRLIHCKFYGGWELYEGKPLLGFFRAYYDQPIWVLHVGPLWIQCNLWGPS